MSSIYDTAVDTNKIYLFHEGPFKWGSSWIGTARDEVTAKMICDLLNKDAGYHV